MKTIEQLTLIFLITMIVSACTPTHKLRGNFLKDDQIASVVLYEDTASDVVRKLGSPTTQSTFDNATWYYIGQTTEKKGIFDARVNDEQIVIVEFDEAGLVKKIEEADAERVDIPYERSKTQTYGNEVTPLQQFLGNLGRFNVPQNK